MAPLPHAHWTTTTPENSVPFWLPVHPRVLALRRGPLQANKRQGSRRAQRVGGGRGRALTATPMHRHTHNPPFYHIFVQNPCQWIEK